MPVSTGIAIDRSLRPKPTTKELPSKASTREPKRRNRVRFSCATCRDKKLKCNRLQPCDQCERRNVGHTCRYIQNSGKDREDRDPQLLSQIRMLQEELYRLQHRLASAGISDSGAGASGNPTAKSTAGNQLETSVPKTPADLTGIQKQAPAGSLGVDCRYLQAENWESVLDHITKPTGALATQDAEPSMGPLAESIEPEEEFVEEHSGPISLVEQNGPILMLGAFDHDFPSVVDVAGWLPSRSITDFFIKRFFQSKEPAWLMFHQPSFWRHYEQFYAARDDDIMNCSPHTRNFGWIALLLIMISRAAVFCARGDERLPSGMGEPMEVVTRYRRLAAKVLSLGDYTMPGQWKLEALILYFGTEYMRTHGAKSGSPILLSVIVRLAVHSGYHRDPRHFKNELSPFESEMRRRLWTVLTEIEILVNFQFGVPPVIQKYFSDVSLPRNLLDEDFDENSIELPPSRPMNERTPALYIIVKSRLVDAFSLICSAMASAVSPSWGKVNRLDEKLESAHDDIPDILKMVPVSQMAAEDVPVDLIMHRIWIELMYLKARIVLHRRYFYSAWTDTRFSFSRFRCINSATVILKIQSEVYHEMNPGGKLHKHRWFLGSLSIHDFLLANMMLCLELGKLLEMERDPAAASKASPQRPIEKNYLLSLISASRDEWRRRQTESKEAQRAYRILSRMLSLTMSERYDSSPDNAAQISAAYRERENQTVGHIQHRMHHPQSRQVVDTEAFQQNVVSLSAEQLARFVESQALAAQQVQKASQMSQMSQAQQDQADNPMTNLNYYTYTSMPMASFHPAEQTPSVFPHRYNPEHTQAALPDMALLNNMGHMPLMSMPLDHLHQQQQVMHKIDEATGRTISVGPPPAEHQLLTTIFTPENFGDLGIPMDPSGGQWTHGDLGVQMMLSGHQQQPQQQYIEMMGMPGMPTGFGMEMDEALGADWMTWDAQMALPGGEDGGTQQAQWTEFFSTAAAAAAAAAAEGQDRHMRG